MVKLICFLKRKPGMSRDDFHRYWREHHGPLVAATKCGEHVLRYEQNPRLSDDYKRDPDGYDGVTIQWYGSLDSFYASIREPDYADIDADMRNFLDVDELVFMLCEEPEVVIDRSGG